MPCPIWDLSCPAMLTEARVQRWITIRMVLFSECFVKDLGNPQKVYSIIVSLA